MSDFVATANALRSRLQEFTALPLYWPNGGDEPTLEDAPEGFVYSEVAMLDGRQISLGLEGARENRDRGEFMIWVNVPRGSSAGIAETYAETIRALFQPTNIPGVVIENRTINRGREVGAVNGPKGRIWCVPVVIDWFADRKE